MAEPKQKISSVFRVVKGIFVILFAAAWLTFAIFYWSQRYPFFRMTEGAYIPWFRNFLDADNFFSVSVYLHFAPFILLLYMLSVLFPKAIGTNSGITGYIAKFISFLLMLTGTMFMLATCTSLPEYVKGYLSASTVDSFVLISDQVYLYIAPGCLVLSLILVMIIMSSSKAGGAQLGFLILAFLFSILFGIMISAASCLIITAIEPVLPDSIAAIESFVRTMGTSSSMFLIALVLAPLVEETAFRGLIQQHLSTSFNPVISIILSSIAFGLWHRNLLQIIYTILFGLIAGALYQITGRLRHCILTHVTMNFAAIMAFNDTGAGILSPQPQIIAARQYLMTRSPIAAGVFAALIILAMIALLIILAINNPAFKKH